MGVDELTSSGGGATVAQEWYDGETYAVGQWADSEIKSDSPTFGGRIYISQGYIPRDLSGYDMHIQVISGGTESSSGSGVSDLVVYAEDGTKQFESSIDMISAGLKTVTPGVDLTAGGILYGVYFDGWSTLPTMSMIDNATTKAGPLDQSNQLIRMTKEQFGKGSFTPAFNNSSNSAPVLYVTP